MRAGVGCDATKLSAGKREGQTPDDGEHGIGHLPCHQGSLPAGDCPSPHLVKMALWCGKQ